MASSQVVEVEELVIRLVSGRTLELRGVQCGEGWWDQSPNGVSCGFPVVGRTPGAEPRTGLNHAPSSETNLSYLVCCLPNRALV